MITMVVRAKIYISGRVQKAGYRDFIDEVAYSLRINGYVKNLEDGRVELICEGEKEAIESLIKAIKIEEYPIRVEDISVTYGDATGEFKSFDIIREEDITLATYERMDLAARYMRQMNKNLGSKIDTLSEKTDKGFSDLGSKIDTLSEKTDKGFSELGNKIDGVADKIDSVGHKVDTVGNKIDVLSEKTDKGFSELGEKIDKSSAESSVRLDTLGKNTGELNEKIDHLSHELPVVVEKVDRFREDTIGAFGELDRKYHVISQNLERLNTNIEKMVEDLGILIREFVEERRNERIK